MRTLMARACLAVLDKIEPGFKTVAQWSVTLKMPTKTASEKLKCLMLQGSVERKMFRIQTGSIVRIVAHYRLIRNPRRAPVTH